MNQSQRVLVAGTGISGIAAAKLVLERGGDVVLYAVSYTHQTLPTIA